MPGQFQLVMRSGPTPGVVFPLESDQITIGRDSTNDVAINDAEVSRRHARLTFQGGKYVVEDMGSTNGTFVNGQRLSGPHVLKPGDVLAFGEQIVLMYDAAVMDPGATVASVRSPRSVTPVPPPVMPAPVPAYAGEVPASPPGPIPLPPPRANLVPLIIAIALFLFVCVCAGFFWWVDATYRWCVFFPFISGCP